MKILIIGYGEHVKKRILPTLINLKIKNQIYILKKELNNNKHSDNVIFVDYKLLLSSNLFFDLIVIATYPVNHLEIYNKVSHLSNNFIIEKPLSNNLVDVLESVPEIFTKNNLFESLAFLYHPYFDELKKIVKNDDLISLNASFTVPFLGKDNFRYNKELGGSSLLDQGFYPITLAYELFEKNLKIIDCNLTIDKRFSTDTQGFANFIGRNGIKIFLKWGMNNKYSNVVTLKTKNSIFNFPFIFSKPDGIVSEYTIINKKSKNNVAVGSFNQFEIMFENILNKKTHKVFNDIENLIGRYNLLNEIRLLSENN